MYKNLSKTEKINDKLLDHPIDEQIELNKIRSMNQYMEEVRRDFLYKIEKSDQSASKTFFTE